MPATPPMLPEARRRRTPTAGTTGSTDAPAGTDTTAGTDATTGTDAPVGTGSGDEPLLATVDPERCAANQAAGTITYLSGFDFAAAASIVDVVVAEQSGYFDDLCLDVELKPSFSTANYPLVAQRPGAVLVGRQLHRDPQLLRGGRRVRRLHRLRQDADRGADHPGRWRHRTHRAERQDDRGEG